MANLKTKIKDKVSSAFSKIADLCVDAVLTSTTNTSFSFDVGAPQGVAVPSNKSVFIEDTIVKTSEGSVRRIRAYFESDGGNYSVYDRLAVGATVYSVLLASDNGFLVTMELNRV